MLKRIEFEAKNLQEAEKYAVETLRIQKDKLKLTVLKEKKGLFNIGSSSTFEATPNVNLAVEGKVYLENILNTMEIKTRMEVRTLSDGEEIHFHVESDENALLIGREGRNIRALEAATGVEFIVDDNPARQGRLSPYHKIPVRSKDFLVKEVHHRVKNNLQIISKMAELTHY